MKEIIKNCLLFIGVAIAIVGCTLLAEEKWCEGPDNYSALCIKDSE